MISTVLLFFQVTGSQSMLRPAGQGAARISVLGWIVFITLLVVAFIMWIIVAWIGLRRRGSFDIKPPYDPQGGQDWILSGGFIVPFIVLTVLFVLGLDTLSKFPMGAAADPPNPDIVVVGHQWWWEIRYHDGPVSDYFTTANEIHIPVHRMVNIELLSGDVIHSFWIPRIHGKEDTIPGQPNYIRIEANKVGIYRGQCAEFCGDQHAHMGMLLVAQTQSDYDKWVAGQQLPCATPITPDAQAGEQVFLHAACVLCHRVRGTLAGGTVAPDLTHIGSRMSLAADTLTNDKASLEAWITHAQSFKPGCQMPDITQFNGVQLRQLTAYLQQLK
ncbi:MAG TPA: cytochrome c oxidase subunit II [Candidatus Acidoferrum sp.]|nr:cytochrome c oxidase subunit II [Candidatus Acidoferrum sp.]